MTTAALIGLPYHLVATPLWRTFQRKCWAHDVVYDFVDVTENDPRSDGVTVVPTIRVFGADGETLAEHRGEATDDEITALIERGQGFE